MSEVTASALEQSQRKAGLRLLQGCLVASLMIAAFGFVLPGQSFIPGAIAFGVTAIAFLSYRSGHKSYRVLIGQALVGQAATLVLALSGTDWQMDAHMAFFVALAGLVALVDIKAILFATATIVLHHLVLGLLMPQLVFPSSDLIENVQRVLFHGLLVVLAVGSLVLSVLTRVSLDRQNTETLARAEAAADDATRAGKEAEELRHASEVEMTKAKTATAHAERAVAELRKEREAREQLNQAKLEAEQKEAAQQARITEEQAQIVGAIRAGLAQIADGDLTCRLNDPFPPEYEPLRTDFNQALAQLSEVLSDVTMRTNDLLSEVAAVSASAADLAGRTERQVASLEETATALKRLGDSVEESAENAKSTANVAVDVKDGAFAGGEVVKQAVNAMEEIEASSREIAKINSLIDGIAFQTNLLALNAGVEAARAGEAGRGFSVVASEVRALSQRATEAAQSISMLVHRSEGQVRAGVELVGEAGGALSGIVGAIEDMTGSVTGIAEASDEQSRNLSNINDSVQQLDSVASSNAAMFEETSAACEALNNGIQTIVQRLHSLRFENAEDMESRHENAA